MILNKFTAADNPPPFVNALEEVGDGKNEGASIPVEKFILSVSLAKLVAVIVELYQDVVVQVSFVPPTCCVVEEVCVESIDASSILPEPKRVPVRI